MIDFYAMMMIDAKQRQHVRKIKHCEWCSHKFGEDEQKNPYRKRNGTTLYVCDDCFKRLEGK